MMQSEEEILARYGLNNIVHQKEEEEQVEEEPQQLQLAIKTGIFKKENLLTLLLMTLASVSGGLALGYFIACVKKAKEHSKQNDKEFQHDLLKMMMHIVMNQKSPEIKIEKHEETGTGIDWMDHAERGTTAPHVRHHIKEENRYPYHDEIQLPPLKIEENWGVERNLNGQVESVYRNSQRYK